MFMVWSSFLFCLILFVLICLGNINDDISVSEHYNDVMMRARWRLKSPAPRLFAQPFVQAQIKENTKALRHWPLWGESISQRAHDDVIKWKHFPRNWPFLRGIPVNSPHKGQWRGALMFSLICVWIYGWVMPQSHPTTGPVRFSSPVRFLACKVEWSARRNFTSVLFSWSHQATGPVRLDTAVYLWFGSIIPRTARAPRAMPVRASHGPRTGIFNVFHIRTGPLHDPQGCRTAPLRTRKGIDTNRIGKIPYGRRIWSYGARTGPYGPRTCCSRAVYYL